MTNAQKWVTVFLILFVVLLFLSKCFCELNNNFILNNANNNIHLQ